MDDIKKLIRSILISSPLEMNIVKLDRDYYEEIGERIPYQKFGHSSLEQFLRSMPDILEVQGYGSNAGLRVIADQKVAHIDRLVSLQRAPNVKKPRFGSRPRRRRAPALSESIPHQKPSPTNPQPSCNYTPPTRYNSSYRQPLLPTPLIHGLIDINFQQPVAAVAYGSPLLTYPPKSTGAIPKKRTEYDQSNLFKTREKNRMDYTQTHTVDALNKTPPLNKLSEPDSKTSPVKTTNLHLHQTEINLENYFSSKNVIDAESISKQSSNNLEDIVYYSEDEDNCTDEEITQPTYEIPTNYNVPFNVQENLRILITKNTNGIWCRDLPKVYKEKFNKPLDYEEYGYRSLIQMCLDLENLFYCYRPSHGDFILYDNTTTLTQESKEKIERQHSTKSNKNTKKLSESNNTEPALVNVEEYANDINSAHFPDNVMRYGDEIPRQFVPTHIQENSFIDVQVAEVYDPSKFWVILKDCDDLLNHLMDAMQHFYLAVAVDATYIIPQHMLKEGLYCTSKYNQEYHRAIIVKINRDNTTVKVFYVDYGTISNANSAGLMFLDKQFASFPRQAIRARLASIWPTTAFTPWSTSASNRFLSLVRQKDLVAHIHKIHEETKILEIFLADTSTEEDIYMNDTLVNEGYALFTNQDQQPKQLHPRKIPKYKYIHLYPNFDDLENGNAPSATEIVRMSKAGVQDEYMYPNYYEDITNENDVSLLLQHIGSTHEEEICDDYNDVSESNVDVTEDWARIVEQESAISEQNLQDLQETVSFQGSSPSPVLITPASDTSTSNAAESSSVTTEPTISKNALKPPPGFENIPRHYYFSSTTINLSNVDNSPEVTNQTNPNIAMFPNNLASNTLPQQLKIPNLSAQTTAIPQSLNTIPSQQPLNPMLAYLQLRLLMNNYQSSQPYLGNFNQNVLINQQNPLFLQQNPFIQQSYLYNQPNPWNNLQLNQNTPININQQPTNVNTPRQLLQNFVHGCLMKGKLELLEHLEVILKDFQDITPQGQQRNLLFRVVCEMIKNPSLIGNQDNLAIIITNFLNLLNDEQIIELATKHVLALNNSNVACNKSDPTKETLEALERLTVNLVEKTEDSKSHSNMDKEVPSIMDEASKSLVFKTDLESRPVHIVQYNNSLYVPVNDALQFTSPKPTLDIIRKTVMLLDPMNCIKSIDLKENTDLARAFLRCGISDSILFIIPLVLLPEVIKIHCGEMDVIKDFKGFLDKVNNRLGLTN
ncbi:hypothetical protein ILUMI_05296 [Ignelater luminosus]|uniref:Tudor domain-containing protein 5 n=1 Tax=Ignelater luminosus TaxID=2038154 RepID=A0A8K0DCL4_IGNLU|nr:hypothetical protein ILUMI_05296 [Ignelater luminosus]